MCLLQIDVVQDIANFGCLFKYWCAILGYCLGKITPRMCFAIVATDILLPEPAEGQLPESNVYNRNAAIYSSQSPNCLRKQRPCLVAIFVDDN